MQQQNSNDGQLRKNPQERVKAVKTRIKKQKIALLRSLKRVSMYLALQCAATIPQAGNSLLGTQASASGYNNREAFAAEVNAKAQVNEALQKRKEWLIKDKFFPSLFSIKTLSNPKAAWIKRTISNKTSLTLSILSEAFPKVPTIALPPSCAAFTILIRKPEI